MTYKHLRWTPKDANPRRRKDRKNPHRSRDMNDKTLPLKCVCYTIPANLWHIHSWFGSKFLVQKWALNIVCIFFSFVRLVPGKFIVLTGFLFFRVTNLKRNTFHSQIEWKIKTTNKRMIFLIRKEKLVFFTEDLYFCHKRKDLL